MLLRLDKAKTRLLTISGLIILGILGIIGLMAGRYHDKKNAQLVLQPQAGDIYEMATENDHYTLLKVGRVQGDSVFVHINEYEANKKSGLSQLRGEPFSPEEIAFTKQTIRVMLKEGKILDVER
jgi:hypothetical protein